MPSLPESGGYIKPFKISIPAGWAKKEEIKKGEV